MTSPVLHGWPSVQDSGSAQALNEMKSSFRQKITTSILREIKMLRACAESLVQELLRDLGFGVGHPGGHLGGFVPTPLLLLKLTDGTS